MRIITRPDFDGIVCAVLLKEVMGRQTPVQWAEPAEIQNGQTHCGPQDVVANLPLPDRCAIWFDHHISNEPRIPFKGIFRVAPSAAALVYEYYGDRIDSRFGHLVQQADKIDAAQLVLDEIVHPEQYPYVLLSMTICHHQASDLAYCDHLVKLLGSCTMEELLADPQVRKRCDQTIKANQEYREHLKRHTKVRGIVTVTDFRGMQPVPDGNRFLVYSLFPETVVNVKLFHEGDLAVLKLGHSIVHRGCHVNVGQLLARYGGGGHRGAGACRFEPQRTDAILAEILKVLEKNEPEDG